MCQSYSISYLGKRYFLKEHYISGLVEGDRLVIQEIYDQYLDSVITWFKRNNGDRSDALDTFQEALTHILLAARKDKLVLKTTFGAYLMATCKYIWLGRLKRKKRLEQVRTELSQTHIYVEDVQLDKSAHDIWLDTFLERNRLKLSDICRRLLALLTKDMKPTEIAHQLNMSNANTVYRRKFACLKSWREHIEADPLYELWKSERHGY